MIILLHTSKTMRSPKYGALPRKPQLLGKAEQLAAYLKTLSTKQLEDIMQISLSLAVKTHEVLASWNADPKHQSLAIDSFVGDIYSGLRADTLSSADREHADKHLRILSGLYDILRPYDGICPYRLEMGYKLPDPAYGNLYSFWGKSIVDCLPPDRLIVNLAAAEYSQTVTPYIDQARIVTPKFMTLDPETGKPKFVVVHAKIARGAFARWLIKKKVGTQDQLGEFSDIGYRFDKSLSMPREPVFVCDTFGGKGLSMRLQE